MNTPIINGKRVYGKSCEPENTNNCIELVYSNDKEKGRMRKHQCYGDRGYGKDGLYCKQHAKKRGEL